MKDSDEDVIAKRIISKLNDVDPEDIITNNGEYSITFSNKTVIRSRSDGDWDGPSYYYVYVNDDLLKCSNSLSKKIFKIIDRSYIDEQERLRIQRIDTSI